jgi:hypothetical protein
MARVISFLKVALVLLLLPSPVLGKDKAFKAEGPKINNKALLSVSIAKPKEIKKTKWERVVGGKGTVVLERYGQFTGDLEVTMAFDRRSNSEYLKVIKSGPNFKKVSFMLDKIAKVTLLEFSFPSLSKTSVNHQMVIKRGQLEFTVNKKTKIKSTALGTFRITLAYNHKVKRPTVDATCYGSKTSFTVNKLPFVSARLSFNRYQLKLESSKPSSRILWWRRSPEFSDTYSLSVSPQKFQKQSAAAGIK